MRSLASLKREAQSVTHWRGHRMRWTAVDHWHVGLTGECRDCPAWVTISLNPPANGIEIGGTAVAVNCGPMAAARWDDGAWPTP